MKLKLGEALLRRKELAGLVETRKALNQKSLFEPVGKRVKVTDSIDDLSLMIPKLTASQVMAEHDFYARQLRKLDALIQQANWTFEVDSGNDDLTTDYTAGTEATPVMVPIGEASKAAAFMAAAAGVKNSPQTTGKSDSAAPADKPSGAKTQEAAKEPTKPEVPSYEKSGIPEKIKALVDKDKPAAIKLLGEFGVKKGGELKAEQYKDFLAKIDGVLAGGEDLS